MCHKPTIYLYPILAIILLCVAYFSIQYLLCSIGLRIWSSSLDASYVKDRPDLTSADANENVYKEYFKWLMEKNGLKYDNALDIHIAAADRNILTRFTLYPEYINKFLKEKTQIKRTSLKTSYTRIRNGKIFFNVFDNYGVYTKYPFNRLNWWPLTVQEYSKMEDWIGTAQWDKYTEGHKDNREYLILVNRAQGVVYVLD